MFPTRQQLCPKGRMTPALLSSASLTMSTSISAARSVFPIPSDMPDKVSNASLYRSVIRTARPRDLDDEGVYGTHRNTPSSPDRYDASSLALLAVATCTAASRTGPEIWAAEPAPPRFRRPFTYWTAWPVVVHHVHGSSGASCSSPTSMSSATDRSCFRCTSRSTLSVVSRSYPSTTTGYS
jgi:hypothetical protein